MHQELNTIALDKCKSITEAFVNCSKEYGLLVVWKCRGLNKQLNDCLHEYTNDEAFQAFKKGREENIPIVPANIVAEN